MLTSSLINRLFGRSSHARGGKSAPSRAKLSRKRLPGFDVLRGIAITLVMLQHSWENQFPSAGIVGVILFFALSGFLISDVLLRDLSRSGKVQFKRFYWNRAIRLYPPLLFMISAYLISEMLTGRIGNGQDLMTSTLVSLLYLADVPSIHLTDGLRHLWTLAVEEQFYVVWPAIIAIAVKRQRVGLAMAICFVLSAAATTVSLTLAQTTRQVYTLPTTWALAMLMGGASRYYAARLSPVLQNRGVLLISTCALITLCFLPDAKDSPATYVAVPAIAFAGLSIMSCMQGWQTAGLLEPIRLLGIISYAVYLWNQPINYWLAAGGEHRIWQSILSPAISVAAAIVSWYFVEKTAARWKRSVDTSMEINETVLLTTRSEVFLPRQSSRRKENSSDVNRGPDELSESADPALYRD